MTSIDSARRFATSLSSGSSASSPTPARPSAGSPVLPTQLQDGFDFGRLKSLVSLPSLTGIASSLHSLPGPKSFPMAGDSTLAQVAQGTTELSVGSKGEPVRKMQEALELAGHKLPRSGADGDFGQETKRALVAFQKAQKIVPANGQLDAKTIAALDTAAASKLKSPEYDKLYADKVLNTTIAIGYDEGGAQKQQIKQTVDGLFSRGYKQFDVKTATDAELKKVGIDPTKVDRDATYFVKSYQYKGKDVQSVVKLITPDTPNAKQKFAEAMNSDEVVMYSGHGRVGSGPDFDDKHSAAGNYVIGKPTVKNYAALGDNDLKKAKLTNDYQLMFFDGCNTKHYVDDLRAIPKNKDSKNLDIVGANTELSWSTSSADVLAMLDGVEGAKSMNEIQADLEKLNKEGPHDKKKHFMTDGFQDN